MKLYFTYLFLILFPIVVNARNAREAFLSMPTTMSADLSMENRTDLIESYEANAEASVQNGFQEDIIIENLTEDYILINQGNSTLQIIVLPMVNESQLYCLIHTVCGPICDSRIEFYSLSWKKLEKETFISITPQSWYIQNPEKFPELSLSFMQFEYDVEKRVLKQINNSTEYLSMEDQKKIKPYIEHTVREYKWNGMKFQ
ncbi:MAG: DUF3256 family protein [Bacteroidales bacterium]|nr:DUF3256 family protein [Bacteroidales bacterium]